MARLKYLIKSKKYYNVTMSYTGKRNNCGAYTTPTEATYTVAAGKYSARTQVKADALAQADINKNAQTYINQNTQCTLWERVTVRPLTSAGTGTWTVPAGVTKVDVFLVGGGGGSNNWAGGGGGYTKTFLNVTVTPGQVIPIIVGNGALASEVQGGFSQFLNTSYQALGGYTAYGTNPWGGGSGGSGGGGSGSSYMAGASDGASVSPGGVGQGTTTRDFGESTGLVNAGGGGGRGCAGGASGYTPGKGTNGPSGGGGGGGGYGGGGGANSSNNGGFAGGFGTCLIRYYKPST